MTRTIMTHVLSLAASVSATSYLFSYVTIG